MLCYIYFIFEMSRNDESLRKSKRQHMPNAIYSAGINELKMESHTKPKRKGKVQDLQFNSHEQEHYILGAPYQIREKNHEQWLPCIFEDGKKIKLQIIPPFKQTHEEVKKKPKSPQKKTTNLLSIFQKVIEDVDNSQEQQSLQNLQDRLKEIGKPSISQQNKARKQSINSEGKITKFEISDGLIKIDQSQQGRIEIPIDWSPAPSVKSDQDSNCEQMKKKLLGCKNIIGMEIFSS